MVNNDELIKQRKEKKVKSNVMTRNIVRFSKSVNYNTL